jgi:3-hydroxyacyl-[acyl-carrier-protein] dehydratase
MRWLWIDTFVEFVSGRRASAVKNLTLGEEYFTNHFPGYPVFPQTLMLEGMAQTAGILVGEARGFSENVILAKIRSAEFLADAFPGDRLRYDAVLESLDDRAGMTSGVIRKDDAVLGRTAMIFSHVRPGERSDFPSHNFVFTDQFVNLLSGFRLGGSAEGSRAE